MKKIMSIVGLLVVVNVIAAAPLDSLNGYIKQLRFVNVATGVPVTGINIVVNQWLTIKLQGIMSNDSNHVWVDVAGSWSLTRDSIPDSIRGGWVYPPIMSLVNPLPTTDTGAFTFKPSSSGGPSCLTASTGSGATLRSVTIIVTVTVTDTLPIYPLYPPNNWKDTLADTGNITIIFTWPHGCYGETYSLSIRELPNACAFNRIDFTKPFSISAGTNPSVTVSQFIYVQNCPTPRRYEWTVSSSNHCVNYVDTFYVFYQPNASIKYAVTKSSHIVIPSIDHQNYYDVMGRRIETILLLDKFGIIKVLPH